MSSYDGCWTLKKRSLSGINSDWQLTKSEILYNEKVLQSALDCLCSLGELNVFNGIFKEPKYILDGTQGSGCISITQDDGVLPLDPSLISVYWGNIKMWSDCAEGMSYTLDYSSNKIIILQDGTQFDGDPDDPCMINIEFISIKKIKDVLSCFPQEESNNCGC